MINRSDLIDRSAIAGIGNVQEQIGLGRFFQGRAETGDQMVRKLADESHRVAQQHGPPARQLPTSRARVERGKQFVFGCYASVGERIHQRAFAGVGVAH